MTPVIHPSHASEPAELYVTTPQNARSLSAEPVDEDGDGKAHEDPDDPAHDYAAMAAPRGRSC